MMVVPELRGMPVRLLSARVPLLDRFAVSPVWLGDRRRLSSYKGPGFDDFTVNRDVIETGFDST